MQQQLRPRRRRAWNAAMAVALPLIVALLCLPAGVTRAQTPLDDFNPNPNGPIYALAMQADGKILVGGAFTEIGGGSRPSLARLNPNGSLDGSFAPMLNGTVYALAVQPDGKVLVGGDFEIRPTPFDRMLDLARFQADGTLDTSFDIVANAAVTELVLEPDGQIIVGGEFTTITAPFPDSIFRRQEYRRKHIARLNPNSMVEESFDPDASGQVTALALQPDGKILVGGWFGSLGGQQRGSLVRLNADGSLDLAFDAQVNNRINALALQADGKIVVGGRFSSIGGQQRNNLARLNADGTADATFTANVAGIVDVLAIQANGQIILGGAEFSSVSGQPRSRMARLNADGSLDPAFAPEPNGPVRIFLVQPDGRILVGGEFTQIGGQPRNRLVRLSNTVPAQQQLIVSRDRTTITWNNSGSGPEFTRVVFELLSEKPAAVAPSATYLPLGEGVRTSDGWQLAGLNLPRDQELVIRIRGFYGSGSIIETEERVGVPPAAMLYLPLVRR